MPPWSPYKTKKHRNGVYGRRWWVLQRKPKSRGHITIDQHIYKNVILVSGITKLSLWTENVGLMTWIGSLLWQ